MDVVREFTFHAALGDALQMRGGPFGDRITAAVGDGWVKGDRISGRLIGPGADWAIVGTDGYTHIDVRTQVRTDDGADLYIHYTGSIEMSEATLAALFGDGQTSFGDNYWFTHVRLESGAPTYQWVNRTLFIGQGRAVTDGIEYEVYRLG
jgi:hypothetical protein